ncbi:putative DCC family thiol-disulfide oxidoreductase YuxK [Geomicrobium halophilum]|uniref:Putative DCC family thiol-disulfide oxidoreductase YuxK n=1 Tax=Geomicrobium halophilum TaxID=549000 RepID=A0A841PYM7_9BACL|nr:DUF393 domain-containing protein [Geomicrobium halophilum]MBB6449315.1 putative DCC family thiol-disulfide oxidoreductase YuxK [Geomicrobium halophilum]
MDQHIVFYDAECPLCRSVKAVLQKLDWQNDVAWFPVQRVSRNTLEKANAYKNMYDEIYMLTKDKKVLTGYNTVRKLLSIFPVTLPFALFLYLPGAIVLGRPIYRFVSIRRYRWFGRVSYKGN